MKDVYRDRKTASINVCIDREESMQKELVNTFLAVVRRSRAKKIESLAITARKRVDLIEMRFSNVD